MFRIHSILIILLPCLVFGISGSDLHSPQYEASVQEAYQQVTMEKDRRYTEMFLSGAQSDSSQKRKTFIEPTKDSEMIAESYRRDLDATKYIAQKHSLSLQEAASLVLRYKRDDVSLCNRTVPICKPSYKYRSIHGTCNNLQQPLLGSANTKVVRIVPADFSNGTAPRGGFDGSSLPNVRLISTKFSPDGNISNDKITHMVMAFGQLVTHDLMFISPDAFVPCCDGQVTPPGWDCYPIRVPVDDPFFNNTYCMDFTRSSPYCFTDEVTRDQLNINTHYLDASVIYGSCDALSLQLRSTTNRGELLLSEIYPNMLPTMDEIPKLDRHLRHGIFVSGDIRVNMVPHLTALNTVWTLEHNYIARKIADLKPQWDDETVYQEARRIVTAEFQSVTYNEYLPAILGAENMLKTDLECSSGSSYDPSIDPSIINSFGSAAFRLHTSSQGTIDKYKNGMKSGKFQLRDTYFHEVEVTSDNGLGNQMILEGLLYQPTQDFNRYITEDLTNLMFKNYIEQKFGSMIPKDMAAIDIQRGRDHGLPGYNMFRKWCGLSNLTSWDTPPNEINMDTWKLLQMIYSCPSEIDLMIGGLAEDKEEDAIVGSTFRCLIVKQFQNLKFGDRFFFTHTGSPGSFSQKQIQILAKRTQRDVLCANTNIDKIQKNVFLEVSAMNPLLSCNKQVKNNSNQFIELMLD